RRSSPDSCCSRAAPGWSPGCTTPRATAWTFSSACRPAAPPCRAWSRAPRTPRSTSAVAPAMVGPVGEMVVGDLATVAASVSGAYRPIGAHAARASWAPAGLPRLLPPVSDPGLAAHQHRLGPRPHLTSADLLAEVEASGLRGRGGAGFPTAVKLSAVAMGRKPAVVANGTEGEPASGKDKTLLMLAPHLVLDRAVLAAQAGGA